MSVPDMCRGSTRLGRFQLGMGQVPPAELGVVRGARRCCRAGPDTKSLVVCVRGALSRMSIEEVLMDRNSRTSPENGRMRMSTMNTFPPASDASGFMRLSGLCLDAVSFVSHIACTSDQRRWPSEGRQCTLSEDNYHGWPSLCLMLCRRSVVR